jgi:hypothetical protein
MGLSRSNLRQTEDMLPRKKFRCATALFVSFGLCASLFAGTPTQAAGKYTPPVSITELNIAPVATSSALSGGKRVTTLLVAQTVKPFTLVGLTWVGSVPLGTEFNVRVRESGIWSEWFNLEYNEYRGVGKDGSESIATRVGSDPLLTGIADGVEVAMLNASGAAPTQMKVTLVGSTVTIQDENIAESVLEDNLFSQSSVISKAVTQNAFFQTKTFQTQSISTATNDAVQSQAISSLVGAVVSPQGALVPRPRIVSRAEWGADETWRDPVPKMGTTLLAGFLHHTASTNSYTPEQAPAQMRTLYAYFTQSLNYADMGYNFLVDKYGTIYEGRSGCTYGDLACDGAAMPAQGAHTAGLNANTFAVSAIGNYDVLAPADPAAMVESIASLMAWKLAPYGLDPNATAYILSTDTSGASKYSAGQTAVTQVISGHRDVGRTACPGRFMYPYMGDIRARATQLLAPVIQGVSVTPTLLNATAPSPVSVSAIIPANAAWSVEVSNADSGAPIQSVSGNQTTSAAITYSWNLKDAAGVVVPMGRYAVKLNAIVGGIALPSATNVVSIAAPPQAVTNVKAIRPNASKTKVSWQSDLATISPITSNSYRTSSNAGATWSAWTATASSSFTKSWKLGRTYLVEVKSANALGESQVVQTKYKVAKFAPPMPAAVTAINFKRLTKNRVTVSWNPAVTEYAASGYYYRVAKNGGKWGKWTKTSGVKTAVTLSSWKKNSTYNIQVKTRNISGYSPTLTTSYTAR